MVYSTYTHMYTHIVIHECTVCKSSFYSCQLRNGLELSRRFRSSVAKKTDLVTGTGGREGGRVRGRKGEGRGEREEGRKGREGGRQGGREGGRREGRLYYVQLCTYKCDKNI